MRNIKLLYGAAIVGALLCSNNALAQITYSEDFEGTVDWSDTAVNYYMDLGCEELSLITSLWSEGYGDIELISVSPLLGVSNGGQATLNYDYKIVNSYYVPNSLQALPNEPAWGSVVLQYAASVDGPWSDLEVVTPQNHIESAICTTKTVMFTPEAGSDVYIRTVVTANPSEIIDALVFFDNIAISQAELCETEAPDLPAAQAVCSNSNIGDLDTGDYATIIWYTGLSGGTPLASGVALVDGGVYYAANFEECESIERTPVTVTINVVEEPEAEPAQSFCTSAAVSDLQVEDDDAGILWYAASTGGAPLAGTAPLMTGNTYYASQTVDGCESPDRTAVAVTINTVEEPEVAATQSFCTSATVSDLQVEDNEATVSWYAVETGGAPLSGTEALVDGNTYYVSQTINGCESGRVPVAVTITVVDEPLAAATQEFCNAATVSDLQVEDNETTVSWYAAETGGTPLLETAPLVDGNAYYASQMVNGCESERTPVTVAITSALEPIVETPQVFAESVLLYDIEVGAMGIINWYATEEDALAGEDVLAETYSVTESGTYYVTQAVLGCESAPVMVEIDIVLGVVDYEKYGITFYPNPVKDIINFSWDSTIDFVTVYNMLGQKMMQQQMNQNNQFIDMGQLSSGTYIITVTSGQRTAVIKVLKQ